jgi:DNA-binding XRE family transcriptional regulator
MHMFGSLHHSLSSQLVFFALGKFWYMAENSLKKIRESMLMSKAELGRKANISPITISRIEKGFPCRMETQRKIILALGFDLSEKDKIFGD